MVADMNEIRRARATTTSLGLFRQCLQKYFHPPIPIVDIASTASASAPCLGLRGGDDRGNIFLHSL